MVHSDMWLGTLYYTCTSTPAGHNVVYTNVCVFDWIYLFCTVSILISLSSE